MESIKKLSPTDCTQKFLMPVNMFRFFFSPNLQTNVHQNVAQNGGQFHLTAVDFDTNPPRTTYEFIFETRARSGRPNEHYFRGAWLAYVQDRQLQAGNYVMFGWGRGEFYLKLQKLDMEVQLPEMGMHEIMRRMDSFSGFPRRVRTPRVEILNAAGNSVHQPNSSIFLYADSIVHRDAMLNWLICGITSGLRNLDDRIVTMGNSPLGCGPRVVVQWESGSGGNYGRMQLIMQHNQRRNELMVALGCQSGKLWRDVSNPIKAAKALLANSNWSRQRLWERIIAQNCNHATELKAVGLRYGAKNLAAVTRSDGFEYLKEHYPSLQSELLKTVAGCEDDCCSAGGKSSEC